MRFPKLLCLACAAALAAVLAGCVGAPEPAPRPRLVVFIAIDGLPQRQVLAYRDQLAPDGFARFLDRGAWFANAHFANAFTVTAAGHATMLTGAYPDRTGIIGNEWLDPATGAEVYNTGDTAARYIGHATRPLDGTSPKNLKAETVGDVLRRADARAKVIAISGKDRGAILPGGKLGTAYMFMSASGQFASSTYYMAQHPAWVDAFNAAKPADRYLGMAWKPLLPDAAYERSLPDDQPWFGRRGGKLPMPMSTVGDAAPNQAFYWRVMSSPFGDELELDFARAAIAGEQLGRDEVPDILAVSLSSHDYVNHSWSAESRLSHDHFLHLDRALQAFFRDLDATVGPGNYLAVLTADHGFMPAPEVTRARGGDAGRVNYREALARVNAGMAQRFGPGRWIVGYSSASLLIDRRLLSQHKVALDDAAEEARRLLLQQEGMDTAYTRRELLTGSRAGAPFFEASRKAWHPDVSGDVQFSLKPNWIFGSSSAATSHGSPHDYDTHVPVLMYGPAWVKPGRVDQPVEVIDIAPTLARLLGLPPPAASQGRLLPLPKPR